MICTTWSCIFLQGGKSVLRTLVGADGFDRSWRGPESRAEPQFSLQSSVSQRYLFLPWETAELLLSQTLFRSMKNISTHGQRVRASKRRWRRRLDCQMGDGESRASQALNWVRRQLNLPPSMSILGWAVRCPGGIDAAIVQAASRG